MRILPVLTNVASLHPQFRQNKQTFNGLFRYKETTQDIDRHYETYINTEIYTYRPFKGETHEQTLKILDEHRTKHSKHTSAPPNSGYSVYDTETTTDYEIGEPLSFTEDEYNLIKESLKEN